MHISGTYIFVLPLNLNYIHLLSQVMRNYVHSSVNEDISLVQEADLSGFRLFSSFLSLPEGSLTICTIQAQPDTTIHPFSYSNYRQEA